MPPKDKVGLTIDRKVWKELVKIKISNDLKTFDDVLNYLLKVAEKTKKKEKKKGVVK